MALNAGDIVAGLRLAIQLHDYGFNQENAADVRYKNFRNDIFNFRHLLEKLDQALQNAHRRYERSAHPTRIHAYSPLSDDFEEASEISRYHQTAPRLCVAHLLKPLPTSLSRLCGRTSRRSTASR